MVSLLDAETPMDPPTNAGLVPDGSSQDDFLRLISQRLNSKTQSHAQRLQQLEQAHGAERQQLLDASRHTADALAQRLAACAKTHDDEKQAWTVEKEQLQIKSEQYAAENERLRVLVNAFISSGAQQQAALSQHLQQHDCEQQQPEDSDLAEEFAKLSSDYQTLQAKYQKQVIRTKSWKEHCEKLQTKNREIKDSLKQWQKYIDEKGLRAFDTSRLPLQGLVLSPTPDSVLHGSDRAKDCSSPASPPLGVLNRNHQGRLLSATPSRINETIESRKIRPTGVDDNVHRLAEHEVVHPENPDAGQSHEKTVLLRSQPAQWEQEPRAKNSTSTQSTQGDPPSVSIRERQDQVSPLREGDLQIVSERPLKRRKVSTNPADKALATQKLSASKNKIHANSPLHVKEEPSSSSVSGLQLLPQDSMDLDEFTGQVDTPTKRKHWTRIWPNGARHSANVLASGPQTEARGSSMPPDVRKQAKLAEVDRQPPPEVSRSFNGLTHDARRETVLKPHQDDGSPRGTAQPIIQAFDPDEEGDLDLLEEVRATIIPSLDDLGPKIQGDSAQGLRLSAALQPLNPNTPTT